MTSIKSFAELDEADLRWIFGMQLLREKVYEAVTADVASEQDQVWARHIVASDETQAQAIYDRLAAGEDFMTVATEVYTGTTSTSEIDLGWFGVGTLGTEVDSVLFNLQLGQLSEPLQTANGWEIFQVLGHEVRTLTDASSKETGDLGWLDQEN
jgi:parvulin-like peptidyl-prolyl isomerase